MSSKQAYYLESVDFDPFAEPDFKRRIPLSKPQEEIWLSCMLGGADASRCYNESVSLKFSGKLNEQSLEKALQDLVNRHESLRCVFKSDGSEILIRENQDANLIVNYLSTQTKAIQQNIIEVFLQDETLKTYDLENGPLFKATLFKLAEQEFHFTFSAHHIICDGWSLGIFLQDLSKLYSAYQQGTKPMLPKAPQMSDYILEQLQSAETENHVQTQRFWLDQFAGNIPETQLPTAFPRPKNRTYNSRRDDFKLNPQLASNLKKTGVKTACSFVVTLLSAFEIWLHQYTNQPEIVLGLPAAGQAASGYYGLTGHCVNLLPLKSTLHPKTSFKDYLKKRKSEMLDAVDHQQFSFGNLLKMLPIKRDASRIPLVPVVFNMDMNMDDGVAFAGLSHQLHYNARVFETFELFLNASGSEQDLTLEWSYNTQLFKPETIREMMADFEKLLEKITQQPDDNLGEIFSDPIKIPSTQQKNTDKRSITDNGQQLLEIISLSLQKHAVKTAIRFQNTEISNGELLAKSNQMATLLLSKGVQKGDLIGVSLDRSIEMIVSLLAILKAGAAYIPLDPNYPQERINYMLQDAEAGFLLINQKYSGKFFSSAQEILLENVLQEMVSYPAENPNVALNGSDLAYVLYTSGSTGKPKGVQIEHHSLLNLLQSIQKWPGISADDRMLALTTISFDIAGLELFLPLISGATIILADTQTSKNGQALFRLIKNEKVSLIQATPATFRLLLDAEWKEKLPIKIFCCGEAMQPDLAEKLLPVCASLYNMYGPTETTIYSTGKQIFDSELITIGFPIDHTQVYILDEKFQPVPPSEIGEIFIAGDGVARGYLNKPDLTADRFHDDPFAAFLGNKMYRTGDLGRFLENNEIEYLGRADHQVKIRGHRVELGEIEAVLSKQEKITQTVVIVREDDPGNQQLVAYVIAPEVNKNFEQQWISIWKTSLKEALPPFMIPAQIVLLKDFPLTPNNKVDRKALPKSANLVATDTTDITAPRTSVEKLVADIWCQVLGRSFISIYDNFFEIGGHSLLAVQIMSRIEKETGKRLPLASLFEASTIEALALLLQMDGQSITWDALVPIKSKGNKTPLYIVHGAGLNVLLFNTLAMHMDQEQSVYGLQAKGLNGIDEPLDKLEDIAEYYVSEIMRHNPNGPYALAGYSFGGTIAYEMAKQLQAMGKKIKMLALFDSYATQTEFAYPKYIRILHKIWDYCCRFFYTFVLFAQKPADTFRYKAQMIRRKLLAFYWKLRDQNEQVGFFGYAHKIDEMNKKAAEAYLITPYNGKIDLFRAKERTYYMQEPNYLGWKKFALKGVQVHEIPGDHNYIFAPPNDKEFAQVLQDCLDKAE